MQLVVNKWVFQDFTKFNTIFRKKNIFSSFKIGSYEIKARDFLLSPYLGTGISLSDGLEWQKVQNAYPLHELFIHLGGVLYISSVWWLFLARGLSEVHWRLLQAESED